MKWNNLMSYCCPICGDVLKEGPEHYHCTQGNFTIAKRKFDEMVAKMYKDKEKFEHNNFSDLNNLGHDKVADDFSDSPFL